MTKSADRYPSATRVYADVTAVSEVAPPPPTRPINGGCCIEFDSSSPAGRSVAICDDPAPRRPPGEVIDPTSTTGRDRNRLLTMRFNTAPNGTSGSRPHQPKVRKTRVFVAALCAGMFSPTVAVAANIAPVLSTVGAPSYHLAATFQAQGAGDLFLDVATNPTVGTSGEFLDENVTTTKSLTADEIAAGSYSDTSRIDPGHYWAMLKAFAIGCDETTTTCTRGLSNVVEFTVPRPVQKHRGLVTVYRNLRLVTLGLRITPAGTSPIPYRVCWTTAHSRKRCASGTVNGYSWFDPASDQVDVHLRDMRHRTTFRWYIASKVVATRTATTIPG